jgi:hypothetical protein
MTMPDDFDRYARRLHAASLEALSPRVQAQLAQRRRAALTPAPAARATPSRWGWGGAVATACVLVVALQLRPPSQAPADAPLAIAAVEPTSADPGGVLAEDPEFYLWLASSESQAYAVE